MEGERQAGGLRCSQVLELLSEAVDGTLTPDDRDAVGRHVADCSTCERFGGQYAELVQAIRREREPGTISDEMRRRVMTRLRKTRTA